MSGPRVEVLRCGHCQTIYSLNDDGSCFECGRKDRLHSHEAALTGRDVLVYALGAAEWAVQEASRKRNAIDDALCREQNVPFAPEPSPALTAADQALRAALDARSAALAALRSHDQGGKDGG